MVERRPGETQTRVKDGTTGKEESREKLPEQTPGSRKLRGRARAPET